MRHAAIASISLLLLAGCGGPLVVKSSDGAPATAEYDVYQKTVTLNANGKVYAGRYVSDLTRPVAPAPTVGFDRSFPEGNAGVALLKAPDGDSMRCVFQHRATGSLGACRDSGGKTYDLATKQQ